MFGLSTLVVLASTAFSAATPLETRDAGTDLLVKDLLRLDQAIRTITYAAGNYTGGTAAYQPIRESFSEVNRTNRIAYYDAMTIKPQNIPDSNRIIAVVANPITPDITQAVNALIAKKALIEAADLSKETADGLNLISYDHDTLSLVAVAPKLNPVTIPIAAGPVLQIDLDWRRGVAAFGGLPLAPITM
ncbi:Putative Cell wall mannoprotein [Septoria linicola]|uniref:Cell wall mannoprotein n=1 Tax=Septoria linicola TaxID=215465 RepID=A0A9Q9AZC2_9PEZI|nr:Putative Cell wall mannoprotein [Septoria linicola]